MYVGLVHTKSDVVGQMSSYWCGAEVWRGVDNWYASADENGRTYFYDEDNSESLWELPDISVSSDLEESKQCQVVENSLESSDNSHIAQDVPVAKSSNELLTSPKLRKKAPKLPVPRQFKTRSLIVPECVNLTGSEDNKGYLPPSFGEGYWPSVQDGHFSITRKGTLNKTKLVEGGKRIRKNWTTSFVVLTDVFLLFYKDIRSAHLANPGIKPELCIDLNGALVEWCPEKSSRKNVFQISTVLGHQLLLQDDNAQTTREWFETIQAAIMNLPSGIEQADAKYSFNRDEGGKKDIKLSRSKSTKQLTADGLYRASGNLSQVQKIRMHVNQDDYSCLKEEEDVHVLTGALKMFFREMKEPLFPFNMFEKFMNAIALPDAISKLEALKKLVQKMPEPNYETLKVLLKHLLRVTEYHKQNRMQVQNLAIVFGPTLMWPEHVSANIALDMMHQNRIVEFLLLEFDAIFSSTSSKNN
ncbi:Rho GTPase-activating protein 15 [Araneus ventricosus]|uniref:Rho GTPase-activating protein 15 n=1 Tax=Araneus ventricosus TaxID=182803 RepID=A0A4Y2AZ89_ARAVE|nr:Rho GTPase-activating protein 15 [Araneus ventricosus]